jgi:hypothetical protein
MARVASIPSVLGMHPLQMQVPFKNQRKKKTKGKKKKENPNLHICGTSIH